MKKKQQQQPSMNGVPVRRPRPQGMGGFTDLRATSAHEQSMKANKKLAKGKIPSTVHTETISEEEVIESTRSAVDQSKIGKRSWRARRKAKKLAKKQKWARRPKWLRVMRRTAKIGGVVLAGYLLITLAQSWSAINNIIDRGGDGALALQENIQPSSLKGEGDGRINIMILGIGGEKHVAGNLADTIIVASIDPFANELAMLSIPRDMWVDIPGYWSSKVNAAHAFGEDNPDQPGGGIGLMRQTLEETLDINLHYYVRIDFQGFTQAIDTVGGVDVTLEDAIYDPNFDNQFGPNALNLPAGDNHLDGQTALLLARSRNATGLGYGTGNDFDRGENQRKIILALKEKILRAGTYSNPVRINQLIATAEDHVRTDIQVSEMLRLYEIMEKIPNEKIISFGLTNASDNYLVSANINGASALQPRGGDYSEIQLFVRELFVDGFIKQEQPVIDVYNGSSVPGLATETATELESYGYKTGIIDNAPTQDYDMTVVYDLSGGKKQFTRELIAKRFNVTMKSAGELPAALKDTTSDFVVILGQNNANEESTF